MRLRAKITLLITVLVLTVVGINSWLYVEKLTQQVMQQVEASAVEVQTQIYTQVNNALRDAERSGAGPKSNELDDLREYFRNALETSAALGSIIDAGISSPTIYEVSIVDGDGVALVSSDPSLPGRKPLARPPLRDLVSAPFLTQLRVIYGTPQAYEIVYPLGLGAPGHQVPFGAIRIAAQVGLVREQITPALRSAAFLAILSVLLSTFLAAVVSNLSLAPLGKISAQLDRISRGEFDPQPIVAGDEFGQVSNKISQIGQQLRGVREMFGTLDQALEGLEDGLLLFSQDGRAVMVTPAVETFLGTTDSMVGQRVSEIFPEGHPLRNVLKISGDELPAVPFSEVEVVGMGAAGATHRIGVSVQVISEGGTRMGALVLLRDPESRERIGRKVQLLDLTKGVAHEVKNPLNSMRLWLENLKESLSPDEAMSRQAVSVLDNEIKRLDSVVKRFLDFMRPAELHRQETHVDGLLDEVAAIARPQMTRSGVELELQCSTVPAVMADRELIRQALLNLVYNAIEAMPAGGKLTLAALQRGDHVEISVSDTGVGISPELRPRVFQLFFTTRPGGNGIGLASVCKTVQMHEGTIDFDSQPGRGTTFRIELPLGAGSIGIPSARSSTDGGVAATKV